MIYLIYEPVTGKPVSLINCVHISGAEANTPVNHLNIEVPEGTDVNGVYVVNKTVHNKPTKPSNFHVFDYQTKVWKLDLEAAWVSVRGQRDALLSATDWRVTKALESGSSLSAPWITYRQALRDVTNQSDPLNITWPVEPT